MYKYVVCGIFEVNPDLIRVLIFHKQNFIFLNCNFLNSIAQAKSIYGNFNDFPAHFPNLPYVYRL